ncbi:restriction endonuclease subunit S [Helicobacter pylori]|uniref:Type IIS restriction enzyme protein n=1 Tax=Helicobacter pylori Hp H-24 TaxID=992039 RepID=I9S7T4_HELPX|nr:restriction endonuclease subunit S [Helicobacter pylori]EJB52834.1 type IIS restriction enzyme protein [Helicobacter pylori Hp H-24]EJC15772.1 type I restriction modification DNA specificity domain protein [Helicobacter pylori Hp H-24b]EJC17146.1 type I restriction modification DNA specificity domain protein [Helicobacter pylori Hp H-24c]EJC40111.1 type IIS restriction enzyme protein [Helicobacter pylori Hp M2]EJC40211.1 type IIS restriction enzyme protein [Helicobacter pylori Hp M1]
MIGPLSSQLNAIKWGEFKLGDLFEASNGDFDIQKRHINHKGEFVITAGLSNNGVLGQSDIQAKVFESHSITIDMFGCAFYRSFPYKMVTHARVFSLKPKFEINHKIGLFLSTLFFDYPKKFGYENMCSWAKIKNDKVILPLKPTAKTQTLDGIDFDFMEKFIAELEQCRLAELEQCRLAELQAYLKATGLENTTLSNDEENALNVFNNKNSGGGNTPCGLTWQHFKLGDLFEVLSSKKIYHANTIKIHDTQIENSYPYVVRAATNNGIKGFIIDDPTFANEKNTLSFAQDTFTVFYQKQPYFTGNKVKILKPKFAFKSPKILHFISAILQFILKPLTWGLGSTTESIAEFKFSLPLKPTANTQSLEDIDFDFMCTLINALMKQTIQGVAQYCSAKIQATKEAINQETPIQKDSLF